RHRGTLVHLPGTGAVAIGLVVQRADRAEIDDVRGQLVVDRLLEIGADPHVLATADRAGLRHALDLLAEADAARAVNAAGHAGGDQRADVLVLDDALALREPRDVAADAHGEVLQLALAALVADRAVERVVDQQELHRRPLRGKRLGRARVDLHALGHGRGAGRQRLRRLFDLDEAHAAVRR